MKEKRAIQTMVRALVHRRGEHASNDMVVLAAATLTVALYAVLFVGLYRWNRHAPIFSPDSAAATSPQVMPWP